MLACVDVDYRDSDTRAMAACVLFRDWQDALPAQERVSVVTSVASYVPGEFYKRELPCLLQVLKEVDVPVELVVVDGYVWLDGAHKPGLGGHLFEALERKVAVVGVAKNHFHGATLARAIARGGSTKLLYVTAAGLDVDVAARAVETMHGPFRIPTLLKRVDQLCRHHPG